MKIKSIYILLIFILIGFVACKRYHDVKVPSTIAVDVISASDKEIINKYSYIGHVEAATVVPLSFVTGGNITSVNVKAGEKVTKGQLIAMVDETNARNSYNLAMATLNRAEDGYKRAKKVYDKGSMSELQWIEISTSLEQAKSMAAIADKKLKDCMLRSPIDGIVSERFVDAGMNVLPSQQVVEIINTDKLIVSFAIPEKEVSLIEVGQKAIITIDALNDMLLYGTIIEQNVTAQKMSHNYNTKISLNSFPKELLPGMLCKIKLQDYIEKTGTQVPLRAVQMDNNGKRFVWIVAPDSTATKRYVNIDDITEAGVLVNGDIKTEDYVIISGYLKISEGTKITIRNKK